MMKIELVKSLENQLNKDLVPVQAILIEELQQQNATLRAYLQSLIDLMENDSDIVCGGAVLKQINRVKAFMEAST